MTVANIDMTRMYLMHDALRRELNRMARATARAHEDPKVIMSTALGWVLFKRFLHIHHTAEDVALWPVMRQALSGRPDELALLDAMEAEHATIQPLLDAIDATVADRNSRPDVLGGLTDALAGVLRGHLKHEEEEALAVIEATITPEQWQACVDQHNQLGADDMPRMLSWVLEDASPYGIEAMLSSAPPAARLKYRNEWQPAYAALDLWRERNVP